MSRASGQVRHLLIQDGGRRVAVRVPVGAVLGDALDAAGADRDGGRLRVIDADRMCAVDPGVAVAGLEDGASFTVVDPVATHGQERPRGERAAEGGRSRAAGPWWGLVAVGLVVVALVLTGSSVLADTSAPWRLLVVVILGAAALAGTAVAVRQGASPQDGPLASTGDRGSTTTPGAVSTATGEGRAGAVGDGVRVARVAGPAALGAGAAVVAVPTGGPGGAHLMLMAAALVVVVLLSLAVTVDPSARSRPALGAAAVIVAVVAGVWGLTLELGWDVQVGAAVLVGAVPVALRALPVFLMDVPDGFFIDYERFQDTRWSVRGRMPAPEGKVDGGAARTRVRGAVAAQVTATVMLSVIGAAALPFAVTADPGSLLVRIGQIVLLVCFAAAMTLLGRRVGVPHLHWVPRGAALVAVGVAAWVLLAGSTATGLLMLGAVGAVLVGLAAGGLAVALGRGARSLVLSRAGDGVEATTVALCLPAGMLAANMLEAIRSAVA
ncbi:MAG: hypothetical protein FWD18_10540 [Micrococcales bacterium]|nr:hypothetical protein [Micrococcales bacterium]